MSFDKILYGAKIALPNDDYTLAWPNPIHGIAVGIKENKIAAIGYEKEILSQEAPQKLNLNGGIICPAFIDTQVNGGGGVLFNDEPTEDGILKILNAHKKSGTGAILPTLISDDLEKITLAIKAVKALIEKGESGILGIHIEGPFLNPQKKGIHNQDKFKKLDEKAIEILSALKIAPSLITIAPEMHDLALLEKLDNQPWVILAAGHSNATAHQLMQAVETGLRGVTHLFNAMSQLSAREAGIVGYALQNGNLYSGIIADLVHVAPQNLRLAYQCLGALRLMLVSDAMPPVGTQNDEFTLYGKIIKVRDGSCFDENGTLAGSALNMQKAVQNMHKTAGIPLGACLQMASETPARFLHLSDKIGSIRIGRIANLIHLNDDLDFQNFL